MNDKYPPTTHRSVHVLLGPATLRTHLVLETYCSIDNKATLDPLIVSMDLCAADEPYWQLLIKRANGLFLTALLNSHQTRTIRSPEPLGREGKRLLVSLSTGS